MTVSGLRATPLVGGRERPSGVPDVVVVGAATRDVAADDSRGWRLGGGVMYSALTVARLGLRTAALIGVDPAAASADELGLLRASGVDVRPVRLERGPVFENIERPDGRLQVCHSPSDPVPVAAIPEAWRDAPTWILAPVAGELSEAWASVPSDRATVALGWQGLLRSLVAGQPVHHVTPSASAILRRADLVGVSRDDLDRDVRIETLCRLLRPGATLSITQGPHGGLLVAVGESGSHRMRRYPAVPTRDVVDPTGAGDVFLAALAAARSQPRLVGGRLGRGFDLLLAAVAASLVIEGPGLHGVPSRTAVRARIGEIAGWRARAERDGVDREA